MKALGKSEEPPGRNVWLFSRNSWSVECTSWITNLPGDFMMPLPLRRNRSMVLLSKGGLSQNQGMGMRAKRMLNILNLHKINKDTLHFLQQRVCLNVGEIPPSRLSYIIVTNGGHFWLSLTSDSEANFKKGKTHITQGRHAPPPPPPPPKSQTTQTSPH